MKPGTALSDANNPTGSAAMAHFAEATGNVRQTHTGVNNSYGGRAPGLSQTKVQLSYGVYETRMPALNLQYHGYDDALECEHAFKAKVTIPEKWLTSPTPVSMLKAFFLKSYRKKFPDAPLSKLSDDAIQLAVKDQSMFVFSKEAVADDAIVSMTFYDRQDVWAMGPQDWADMEEKLKAYRRTIVRYLAHCHRSSTDSWELVTPVTSAKQLSPTNCYVVFTGWYKMQCVVVQPHLTIADLKVYLHEKNGSRMPLECIDIGVRSGDDVKIIDDALTLQRVYELSERPDADYMHGPGTYGEWEEREAQRKADEKEAVRLRELEQRAEAEIEANRDKRGPDGKYFRRHDTTSRVHAEWDNPEANLKTFSVDDQPHSRESAEKGDLSDVIGPQMPMYLRKTHKDKESKYAHLVTEDGSMPYLTREGAYAERPTITDTAEKAAPLRAALAAQSPTHPDSEAQQLLPVGLFGSAAPPAALRPRPKPHSNASSVPDSNASSVPDLTNGFCIEDVPEAPAPVTAPQGATAADGAQDGAQTLAGLEPELATTTLPPLPPPATPAVPSTTSLARPSFVGKTLVLGVGKRIQDEKHKIWVATVHDPYSFRGPEDRAAGGGPKESLDLQQNGAPKGWSAPAIGEASINQDENCCIM
jgi:hypothetical protein